MTNPRKTSTDAKRVTVETTGDVLTPCDNPIDGADKVVILDTFV